MSEGNVSRSEQTGNDRRFAGWHIVVRVSITYRMPDSMAMSSEPAIARTEPSCRNLNEMVDFLQGSIYFVQKLTASNVRTACELVHWFLNCINNLFPVIQLIPRWFLREHGNKFRRLVVLRSGPSHKPWLHWLKFYTSPSRPVPEISIASGWRDFVSVNGLIKGDQLIFLLTAMSEFQVYIFDGRGDQKTPQMLQAPVKSSDEIELSERKTKQFHGCKCDEVYSDAEEFYADSLENKVCPVCAKPKATSEHEFAGAVSSETFSRDSSLSDTPSTEAQIEEDFLWKNQICLPSFSGQLVAMNVSRLEIPMDFATTYGSRLRCFVQLQGILEDSPLHNVQLNCSMDKGNAGIIYMEGDAWEDFVRDNMLWVGQELVFTLTADSFFTVREEIFWNPRTGLSKVPLRYL